MPVISRELLGVGHPHDPRRPARSASSAARAAWRPSRASLVPLRAGVLAADQRAAARLRDAATAAVVFRNSRRLNSLMLPPSVVGSSSRLKWLEISRGEPSSARRVEQMRPRRDPARDRSGRPARQSARSSIVAVDVLAVEAAIELRVGAGRLDDDDIDRQPASRRARSARGACRRARAARRRRGAFGAAARTPSSATRERRRRRRATTPGSMFIAGEPMKPATKVLAGRS